MTAIGTQGEIKLRRNSCKPDEIIMTTGLHGLSKLGLMIKNRKFFESNIFLTQTLINRSLQQFCKPKLNPKFLQNLLKARPNKKIKTIGCTDSSDGLFQALLDLSIESNCKAIVDYRKIPKHKNWPQGEEWDKYYFLGGEDYELVFSLPRKWANNLITLDDNISEIGFFTEGSPSVEFKNLKNDKFLKSKPFKHF